MGQGQPHPCQVGSESVLDKVLALLAALLASYTGGSLDDLKEGFDMKPLKPHEAGYIRRLIERALTDPEGVRRELEAKEHLSLAEFNILEALKQCKEVRSCKYCGRPFVPKWKNQKYCSKSCRIVYHSVRYKRCLLYTSPSPRD